MVAQRAIKIYNDDCSSRSSCHGERTLSKTGEANPLVCFCGTYRGVLYVSHHRSTERGAVILIGIGPHHERLQPHTACTLNIKVVLVRTEVRRPSCRGLCVHVCSPVRTDVGRFPCDVACGVRDPQGISNCIVKCIVGGSLVDCLRIEADDNSLECPAHAGD